MDLIFESDDDGNHFLFGRTFDKIELSHLQLAGRHGKQLRLEDCKFINCSTSPGTCMIGSGVTLRRVEFSNFDCGDAIRIDAAASLQEVVISGVKPASLVIQPDYGASFTVPELDDASFHVDITDYLGEVTILGLRGDCVRKSLDRQVTVLARWKEEINWNGLGIGPLSFWRIFIKKLTSAKVSEGVFSLPDVHHKKFAQTQKEKKLLEDSGIRFL